MPVPRTSITGAPGLSIRPKVFQDSTPTLSFQPSLAIVARDVDKLGLSIRSFRDPLRRAVQRVVIPSIQRNFESEGRPSWEPYSEGTYEIRNNMGKPIGSLLNMTGALQAAMKRVNIWTFTTESAYLLDLPGNVWYGKVHQEGRSSGVMKAKYRKRSPAATAFGNRTKQALSGSPTMTIPARPFIMLQEEDHVLIEAVFVEWLNERIALHWSRRG